MSNADTSRRAIEEGFNQGNLSSVDEIAADGFRNHDPADGGEYVGRDGAKRQIEMFRAAFPDLHITIDRYEDGKIVESWTNWDTLGLMRQLGAAPEPGSLTEKVGIQLQHLAARRQRAKASVN
jgi:predicted ester cyclase